MRSLRTSPGDARRQRMNEIRKRLSGGRCRPYRTEQFDPSSLRLGGSFSNPHPFASSNTLNSLNSDIRTKMAVVRLRRRKWGERDGKRPEVGLAAAARGSDKWPEKPTFCRFPTADQSGKRMSRLGVSSRRERNCGRTLFCNRAARVKGSKLALAPRMVVWQGPLFCPRSARAAAASWSQARARRINLRGCVMVEPASSSGHHRGFVDVTVTLRPCRTLPPERNS